MGKSSVAVCALCGNTRITTREHVIPRALYPKRADDRTRRITIHSCHRCNNGSSDDDVHFRNVLSLAGEANEAVRTIWEGAVMRSFRQPDGLRRLRDLSEIMRPSLDLPGRTLIYPAEDPRILQSVRKIVRGLCAYKGWGAAIPDELVFADVLREEFPVDIFHHGVHFDANPEVFDCFAVHAADDPKFHSIWSLRFFERTIFTAAVFTDTGKRHVETDVGSV